MLPVPAGSFISTRVYPEGARLTAWAPENSLEAPVRRLSPIPRLARAAAVAALITAAGACQAPPRRASAEEAVLERQREGLQALIRAAERGPLVPFGQVLVVVHQGLVQDLLSAAMPYERTVAGKYRIRIDAARVAFDDGFALVRFDGRASRAGHAFEEDVSAEVSVFGGLDIVELDPVSGILRGRVKIIAVEARRAALLGLKAPVERLVESLGREKLETFSSLASGLEIPVSLERSIAIPAARGEAGIRIAAAAVPVRAAVLDVKAFRGRLWISITASAGAGPAAGADP